MFEEVGFGRSQAAGGQRTRRGGADHGLAEWIVAAGIEDDQPQLLGLVDALENAIERHRFVVDVAVALQHGIHGDHVVRTVDLDAVAGIVDDGDIGGGRLVVEIAQRTAHVERADVAAQLDRIEARLLEHVGDRGRIVRRVRQLRDVLIGRVADHQRDPFCSKRIGVCGKNAAQQGEDKEQHGSCAHDDISQYRALEISTPRPANNNTAPARGAAM